MSEYVGASVLLVASEARSSGLASLLRDRVAGQSPATGYRLEVLAPDAVPDSGSSWEVVVIDGESVADEASRRRVFARVSRPPHLFATILFVCSPAPSEQELEHALAWADDLIYDGWEQGERVRRRVQVVVLAPGRRLHALRERSGLPGGLHDRATAFSSRILELVDDTFEEGHRAGWASAIEKVDAICERFLGQVEDSRRAIPPVPDEAGGDAAPSANASRLGGASGALEVVRRDLLALSPTGKWGPP